MNRILLASFAFLIALSFETGAHAFYCQNRLVIVGDPQARVRALCGDPAGVSERVLTRSRVIRHRVGGSFVEEVVTVSVVVELWLYDFGPQRFMQELAFEGGRLLSIEALTYGTQSGRAMKKSSAAYLRGE